MIGLWELLLGVREPDADAECSLGKESPATAVLAVLAGELGAESRASNTEIGRMARSRSSACSFLRSSSRSSCDELEELLPKDSILRSSIYSLRDGQRSTPCLRQNFFNVLRHMPNSLAASFAGNCNTRPVTISAGVDNTGKRWPELPGRQCHAHAPIYSDTTNKGHYPWQGSRIGHRRPPACAGAQGVANQPSQELHPLLRTLPCPAGGSTHVEVVTKNFRCHNSRWRSGSPTRGSLLRSCEHRSHGTRVRSPKKPTSPIRLSKCPFTLPQLRGGTRKMDATLTLSLYVERVEPFFKSTFTAPSFTFDRVCTLTLLKTWPAGSRLGGHVSCIGGRFSAHRAPRSPC